MLRHERVHVFPFSKPETSIGMKYRIALAQTDSRIGNLKDNLKKHISFVHRAIDGDADIVVFPELSLTGYTIRDAHWDVAIKPGDTRSFGRLIELSKKISILLGGIEESLDHAMYNSAFLIERGVVRSVHRKIYLPTYGMFEESRYFSAGKTVRAFDSRVGRAGVLVCEDLWHPFLPCILGADGADIIFTLSASPTRLTGEKGELAISRVNAEHHKTYARLLSTYMVFCNRVGYEDGLNFWGGSEVVNPMGEVVIQAKHFEEDMVFVELNTEEIKRARRLSRHFLDDDERIVIEELQRISASKRRTTN
jgi:predicted amidohydrolase